MLIRSLAVSSVTMLWEVEALVGLVRHTRYGALEFGLKGWGNLENGGEKRLE